MNPSPHTRFRMPRRRFLRAGGVSIALPLLESLAPRAARAAAGGEGKPPMRLLLAGRFLGTNADYFFPRATGLQYEAPRYLRLLESHRGRFTVFSGMSHLGYPNAHPTEAGLFTGAPPERIFGASTVSNTVSLDQLVAERIAGQTRHASLAMGAVSYVPVSWDSQGVPVPLEERPEEVFKRLFIDGPPGEMAREARRLQEGRSILDGVRDQLRRLTRQVGAGDREQLEIMAGSIRQAEQDLARSQAWAGRPKPRVAQGIGEFQNAGWASGQRMRHDLAFLAFQGDLTRVCLSSEGVGNPGDAPGTVLGHHEASHHSRDPKRIEQLALFEEEETRQLARLLDKLAAAREGDSTLLDRTIVIWASNLGNPSAHASDNLPILVAGGGFRHQGHVAFNRERNKPLSNLYLRVLHQLGIDVPRFGMSTEILTELG